MLVSSATDINILNHKITTAAFNDTNTVDDAPFYFNKTVADYLVDSNDRFIAVYYGTLLVKGPYDVMGNVLRRKASGYIYIKSGLNQVKYLYAICLPKLTEEKSYLLPHAYLKFNKSNICLLCSVTSIQRPAQQLRLQ